MVGGAFEDAADLISESWSAYHYAGRAVSIRAWLERLPADVVAGQPRLIRAGARLASSDPEPVRGGLMDTLRRRYPEGPDALLADLFGRSWRGDAGGAVAAARRVVAAEPEESDFWPEACELLGWCLYVNDDLDESVDWLEQARMRAAASGQPVIAAVSAAELSLVAGEQERQSDQQRFAEEAYAGLAGLGLADAPGYEAIVHTARGAALAAQGALDEALDLLERGLAMRPPTRFQILDAIVPLIPVVRRVGDRGDVAALLAEARTVLAGCRDPGGFRRRLAAVEQRFDRRPLRSGEDLGELSAAELRVLYLLDAGLSERQVGSELFVSFNTVHGHVKSIYNKLRVSSRQQALDAARSLGLL
jgi:LuxR family transcriptional regulator, maltose regulon positive regulatory protein